jgi:hypothetical protein
MELHLKRPAVLMALLLSLAARPAFASGHSEEHMYDLDSPVPAPVVILGLFAPSEIGVVFPHDSQQTVELALGWSWQVPIPTISSNDLLASRHHLAGGVDYVPADAGPHLRGRVGYRYDRRHWFAGPAVEHAGNGLGWSPEVGVKFFNFRAATQTASPSLHVLVRADVATGLDSLRDVVVLFGWSVF